MEIGFQLRERTVALIGPLTSVTQHLAMGLTQVGADVAFILPQAQAAQRFASQLSDSREINEKFGRAAAFECALGSHANVKEAIGRVAQTFGSVDILIDANMTCKPSPLRAENSLQNLDEMIAQNLKTALYATHEVLPFFKTKKRGRILFLTHDASLKASAQSSILSATRNGLTSFAQTLSAEVQDINVTVNVLSLGYTEEFLQAHFPECKTIKEAFEKQKQLDPLARILEGEKLTNSVAYLISQLGAGVTGQTLRLS